MCKQLIFFIVFLVIAVTGCRLKGLADSNSVKESAYRQTYLTAKAIAWDQSTLQRIAPLSNRAIGYCGYPRMIQLHNKNLICVYEVSGGSIESIKSFDKGNAWSAPVIIATKQNGINMAVPEILELKDHSLLVSYNPRPPKNDTAKHFGIRTKKSYDGGLTWIDERLLYEAGSLFGDGCWEPSQIQLPSGEVLLFFSNEGIYTKSNEQNISIFRSKDNGLSWTTDPQIVSFRSGKRDGMAVPILSLRKDELLFSIEDNANGQFKPSVIQLSTANNFNKIVDGNSDKRHFALAETLPDSVYAGAPYLRRLKTGATILSYQGTEGRTNNWEQSCMFVVVGDKNGNNFTHKSKPFDVPLNKHALWNSLCVLDDNTVIALASTNAFSANATEVWMIKGYLN